MGAKQKERWGRECGQERGKSERRSKNKQASLNNFVSSQWKGKAREVRWRISSYFACYLNKTFPLQSVIKFELRNFNYNKWNQMKATSRGAYASGWFDYLAVMLMCINSACKLLISGSRLSEASWGSFCFCFCFCCLRCCFFTWTRPESRCCCLW